MAALQWRRLQTTLMLATVASTIAAAQQPTSIPVSLVFDHVTVVDVEHGELLSPRRVVVAGNRIQAVGDASTVAVPQGAQIVDARGKYLIPGLWDMHYHVDDFVNGNDPAFQDTVYRATYPLFVAYGVTGIREMAQRFLNGTDSFRVWQRAVLAGERMGPRAIGPSVDLDYSHLAPQTPADARRIIDSLKAAGLAFVKYHGEPSDTTLFFSLLSEAKRAGLPIDGHMFRYTPPEDSRRFIMAASDRGQRSIEHTRFRSCYDVSSGGDTVFNAQACAPVFARLASNGTWIVPTLTMFYFGRTEGENPFDRLVSRASGSGVPAMPMDTVLLRWQHLGTRGPETALATAQRAGVGILAGTDGAYFSMASPGFGLHLELEFLVENGGLTPLEALRTATLNPAKFLKGTDSLGTVTPGRLADLVLLDADPLVDIRNTNTIRAVVANGRYFDRATLDSIRVKAKDTWPRR